MNNLKLCVNYLEETKELLEEGKIDFIDYIKLFSINGDISPLEWCITKKDVMFHGMIGKNGGNIADKNFFENRDLDLQRKYFEISKTPYISMHINSRIDPNQDETESLQIIKDNVARLKAEFGKEIILENVPASKKYSEYNFYSNPEFICKVIDETSCGFLFDIGHAKVASEVFNIPFDDYVSKLPMDKIVEIHLAGCKRTLDGNLIANHSKMNEEDYNFLNKLLVSSKSLRVVTLEYGTIGEMPLIYNCPVVKYGVVNQRAKEEVYEQLIKLKEMLKS